MKLNSGNLYKYFWISLLWPLENVCALILVTCLKLKHCLIYSKNNRQKRRLPHHSFYYRPRMYLHRWFFWRTSFLHFTVIIKACITFRYRNKHNFFSYLLIRWNIYFSVDTEAYPKLSQISMGLFANKVKGLKLLAIF